MDQDDSEFILEPAPQRQKIDWSSVGDGSAHALTSGSVRQVRQDAAHSNNSHATSSVPRHGAEHSTSHFSAEYGLSEDRHRPRSSHAKTSSVGLPVHRDYPTLESIQRLYRLAGYTGVIGVFGYLVVKFYTDVGRAPSGEQMAKLVDFVEYAVPFTFGTVVIAGVLFGASEGIKLAIDIQENTLAAARKQTPRSE